MDLAEYKEHVKRIPYGKRVHTALYLFREEVTNLGEDLDLLLAGIVKRCEISAEFNVVKFRTDELKISILAYPEFLSEAHPALRHAITIDLATGKARHTDYADNANPPILHRKESLVSPKHPMRAEFAALTRVEEAAGLYEDSATIGFKLNWERLLAAKGLIIRGHTLQTAESGVRSAECQKAGVVVERHKTALTRYELSKPVKSLLEYGVLRPGTTFFDYGCGQGSDVRGLQALGYPAEGWDPVFQPEVAKREADVVNLGYVVNVIEDPAERLEALVDAYRHARRVFTVAALITETVETGHCAPFGDGVLTRRNTFQKYFEQQELHQYIEDALETTAVPVGLGVFYVFRDPAEQQDFLSARSRRAIDWTQISARLGLGGPPADHWEALYEEHKDLLDAFGGLALRLGRFPAEDEFGRLGEVGAKLGSPKRGLRAFVQGGGAKDMAWGEVAVRFGIGVPAKARSEVLCEEHKELLDAFWSLAVQLGRTPAPEEFARYADLAQRVGSGKRAMALFVRKGGADALKRSAEARRNDLLVYLAMANLRRKVPFGHLSASLRLDVRKFFWKLCAFQGADVCGVTLGSAFGSIPAARKSCPSLATLRASSISVSDSPLERRKSHLSCTKPCGSRKTATARSSLPAFVSDG
jgi:hypothetical protein